MTAISFLRYFSLIVLLPFAVLADSTAITSTGGCQSGDSSFQTGVTGIGTTSVTVDSECYFNPPSWNDPSIQDGSTVVTLDLYTDGPVQSGYLDFSLTGGTETNGGSAAASFSVNGTPEGSCGFTCSPSAEMIPFTLGVPFEIQVTTTGSSYQFPNQAGQFGSGEISVTFSAGEMLNDQGFQILQTTPILFADSPVSAAPEPAGLGMEGLLALRILLWVMKRSGSAIADSDADQIAQRLNV